MDSKNVGFSERPFKTKPQNESGISWAPRSISSFSMEFERWSTEFFPSESSLERRAHQRPRPPPSATWLRKKFAHQRLDQPPSMNPGGSMIWAGSGPRSCEEISFEDPPRRKSQERIPAICMVYPGY